MDDYLTDRRDALVPFGDEERQAAIALLERFVPALTRGSMRERGRPDRPLAHIDDATWSAMWALQDQRG